MLLSMIIVLAKPGMQVIHDLYWPKRFYTCLVERVSANFQPCNLEGTESLSFVVYLIHVLLKVRETVNCQ